MPFRIAKSSVKRVNKKGAGPGNESNPHSRYHSTDGVTNSVTDGRQNPLKDRRDILPVPRPKGDRNRDANEGPENDADWLPFGQSSQIVWPVAQSHRVDEADYGRDWFAVLRKRLSERSQSQTGPLQNLSHGKSPFLSFLSALFRQRAYSTR